MNTKQNTSDRDNTTNQTDKRWFIISLSLLLITGLLISLFYIAENRAKKSLLMLINRELTPNAELILDDFSLTLLPIGFSLKGARLLHLLPGEDIYPEKPADAIQYLTVEEITLSGVRLLPLIRRDHLHIRNLILKGVDFGFVNIDGNSEDRPDIIAERDPFPITVSHFRFEQLNIQRFDHPKSDSASLSVQNLSGKITALFLPDPSSFNNTTLEELEITVDHFSHFTENGFYEASLESFLLNSADDHIAVQQFRLRPLLSARQMALNVGHPIDKYDLQIPGFKIEKIDLIHLLNNKEFLAGNIILTEPTLLISRDNSLPRRDREDRVLPHIQFKNLPMSVSIDSIYAQNGTLYYFEEISDENRSGAISFTEIDLTLSSLVNRSTTPILAEATARFMDQSDFDLQVEFSLEIDAGHRVSGNLYRLDLTSMNSTLENLVLIRLDSGELHQLNFRFHANDDRAYGDLLLIYSDLDIRFIDFEEQRERRLNRIRSFIANTFVIRANNLADDPRSGEIEFDRDKERSIFNFWLRSISTGLLDTVKR